MVTKAVILAAGRGSLLQPLTSDTPSPMVPLLGKPVMEHLIEHLVRQGIREILVNVSHLAHRIENYFGDGSRWGIDIGYSFEGHLDGDRLVADPVGTAGVLKKIHEFGGFIDDTTLIVNGDAIIDLDVQAAARGHRERGAMASVITRALVDNEFSAHGMVISDDEGRVMSFHDRPGARETSWRTGNAGIYLIEPAALEFISVGRACDIGAGLLQDLVRRGLPVYVHCSNFDLLDIGRIDDYWRISQQLMLGKMRGIRMPGTEVVLGVHVGLNVRVDWTTVNFEGPVYIGSGACIESGCTLRGPVWVGAGCHIETGALIERSVLFDYAHVGAHAIAKEMILSRRYCLAKDGQTLPGHASERSLGWWGDARMRRTSAVGARMWA